MIDLYNAPSPEVLEWIEDEIRSNLIKTSQWLVSKGKDPIKYTNEDIECLVQDFLSGVHEYNTVNIASRFNIDEEGLL